MIDYRLPITPFLLREQAQKIALKFDIIGFSASKGWFNNFRKRNNLKFKIINPRKIFLFCESKIFLKKKQRQEL